MLYTRLNGHRHFDVRMANERCTRSETMLAETVERNNKKKHSPSLALEVCQHPILPCKAVLVCSTFLGGSLFTSPLMTRPEEAQTGEMKFSVFFSRLLYVSI